MKEPPDNVYQPSNHMEALNLLPHSKKKWWNKKTASHLDETDHVSSPQQVLSLNITSWPFHWAEIEVISCDVNDIQWHSPKSQIPSVLPSFPRNEFNLLKDLCWIRHYGTSSKPVSPKSHSAAWRSPWRTPSEKRLTGSRPRRANPSDWQLLKAAAQHQQFVKSSALKGSLWSCCWSAPWKNLLKTPTAGTWK